MWIFVKLTISLIAFFIRLVAKYLRSPSMGQPRIIEGVPTHVGYQSNKGRVHSTTVSIQFHCRSVFKLTQEASLDRFFKQIGLSKEIQTRDQKFDEHIYIASDSSAFMSEISIDAKTREMILELFMGDDCQHISCDGRTLRIKFTGEKSSEELYKKCVRLYQQMLDIDKSWTGLFHDPFIWKAIIIESLIWSLAAYAMTGFMEWMIFEEDLHFDPWHVFTHGLLWGIGGALFLLVCIILFLKGSSRGHRIIIESALVLGLSLPVGGVNAVSDINTKMDQSVSQNYVMNITNLYEVRHRRKRGYYYTYHLQVFPISNDYDQDMPLTIKISHEVYKTLSKNGKVKIEVGQGRLNYRWFRSITPTT